MIDLLTDAPDGWQVGAAQGFAPSIRFYYGVQAGQTQHLPIGAWFGVVTSPNQLVHPQSPLHPWAYIIFEVALYQFRSGRPLERSYQQVERRQLTRFEVPHFEALWLDVNLIGRPEG